MSIYLGDTLEKEWSKYYILIFDNTSQTIKACGYVGFYPGKLEFIESKNAFLG